MFGRGQRDLQRLKTVKAGLQEKLKSGSKELMSLDGLNQLAALHVNAIRLTRFMPCRVSAKPGNDLDQLFEELVEAKAEPKPLSKVEELIQNLDRRFAAPEISNRIRRNLTVRIPVLDRDEEIPYGYQNGRLNLIAPVVFPTGRTALEAQAAKYAVEGKSLYETPDDKLGELQMLVVGQFAKGSDGVETVRRILESHDVRLFRQSDLPLLTKEIKTHGHPVTP